MTPLKRVNYFAGRLLSAADFQAEQEYHREKQRLHIRALHGFGVVAGLNVSAAKDGNGYRIMVEPGLAIDGKGEIIELCMASQLRVKSRSAAALVYLRYTEHPSDELTAVGTGSDESAQPSRIEEGCELVLVDEAPRAKSNRRRTAASNPAGVALARLVRTRTDWRLDRKFKVARVR